MRYFFITFSALFFLAACKKEATVKLPEVKPLPVMYSYICPDDTIIKLKLYLTQPLYTKNDISITEPVKDAYVFISSTQGGATLVYNTETEYYELKTTSYPIKYNETYKMEITLANGTKADAYTTVPANTVAVSQITYDKVTTQYDQILRFNVGFMDDPSYNNYYNLALSTVQIFDNDTIYNPAGNILYTDNKRNGEFTQLFLEYYYQDNSSDYAYDFYLLNCSKDYYLFHNSVMSISSGGNPFAEPTLTYTNVKNGRGVFASYTRTRYRVVK